MPCYINTSTEMILKTFDEGGDGMKEKELRRSLAVFPIGTVMKLTDLTARQIRYYEEQGLIQPQRSEGNRRIFSLRDIDYLLEIKDYLAEGMTMAEIKHLYEIEGRKASETENLTDDDVRQILYDEIAAQGGLGAPNPFLNSKG